MSPLGLRDEGGRDADGDSAVEAKLAAGRARCRPRGRAGDSRSAGSGPGQLRPLLRLHPLLWPLRLHLGPAGPLSLPLLRPERRMLAVFDLFAPRSVPRSRHRPPPPAAPGTLTKFRRGAAPPDNGSAAAACRLTPPLRSCRI